MGQVNGMRVMVNVLGIAALGWSVCCPWWVCRWETDEELPARMEQWKSFPEIAAFVAETEVKMVPLWRIEDYGKREWMTFNIIQWGAVVGLWTLGLQFARDFDAPRAALPGEAARESDAGHRGVNEPGACPPILR